MVLPQVLDAVLAGKRRFLLLCKLKLLPRLCFGPLQVVVLFHPSGWKKREEERRTGRETRKEIGMRVRREERVKG